ncbi:hypothetical protein LCGC14_1465510 [marine sediment metagenome]|uniref:Uncharacterized protein n=1 Tax=marine sediment metagenome TaxID=412755 RepID=A0A0F9JZV1_9ZZZZ
MRYQSQFLALMLLVVLGMPSVSWGAEKEEACRRKLVKAQELGMLYDLDWKPPKEPRVVVGKTFFRVAIDAKEGFAETLNCFLMGGDNKYINFNLIHWRTGKKVGRWSYGRLKMY